MLLTGDKVDAHTAAQWGLVNGVVAAGALRSATLDLARRIAQASPAVVAIGKQAFYRQIEEPVEEAYAHTRDVMVSNAQACDAQEGISAFLAKRQPQWTGR